jgi:hypothetical protein
MQLRHGNFKLTSSAVGKMKLHESHSICLLKQSTIKWSRLSAVLFVPVLTLTCIVALRTTQNMNSPLFCSASKVTTQPGRHCMRLSVPPALIWWYVPTSWICEWKHLKWHTIPGIAQWYSAGLRAGWSGVRVPAGPGNFSLHHRVQTGSGTHPSSYPTGTRGSFLGGKAAGAWTWPLTSICCRHQGCV